MTTLINNQRLLQALKRQPVDKTPIWIMRQAGRYLPEYRKVRAQAGDFMTLCKTPELACEVTLQPLARFDLDAAIIFSDILTIPDAMGLGLYFIEGEGPKFKNPMSNINAIQKLGIPDPIEDLGYVMQAIQLVSHELKGGVPLIGFSGSPWTLATYMVEGGASRSFMQIKKLLQTEPQTLEHLLNILTLAIIDYLKAQIQAGVSAVMLFDTWGGILSAPEFQHFSLNYMQQIIHAINQDRQNQPVPIILFTKGGGAWLNELAQTGCHALSLDASTDIGQARVLVGNKVALQGNLEPTLLIDHPKQIEEEVARILEAFGPHPGHIFNLGHGILPSTPPEIVGLLVDAVHKLSVPYHKASGQVS